MAQSAGEYVSSVNTEFRGLLANPTQEQFAEYTQACKLGELDPDVVAAFNHETMVHESAMLGMELAADATETNGAYLFKCNGYMAIADEHGIVAVHSALVHIDKPLTPDPVELVYPGYSNMALVKLGRTVVAPSQEWPTLGQARDRSSSYFAGVTGGLFAYEVSGQVDIRAELAAVESLAATLDGVDKTDWFAGLADQVKAEIALWQYPPILSIKALKKRAISLVGQGVNIH